MKYGKRSVLSLSMAFGDEDQPHPTVIHRGSQAVIGNIELTESHVEAVVEKASEIVDVVCIDVRLTEYDSRVTFDDDILWFDSRDAIARSLTHIVLHQNYSNVLIVGDNESVEAVESHFSWADIPIRTRHPDSIDDESIEWCDLLIGFTQTNIGTRVIERLDRDTTVIDAGLSSFSEDAIDSAMNRSIEMVRSDVRAGYISEISCTLITEELATRHMGRTEYEGVTVVAGGIIGDDGDVVVDSIETPTSIFGVADGNGGIKQEMSDVEQRHINTVRELLE
jgi:hypothetical protein